MADKQIGIKLDVKQTGLQQVDDALDTISKNLKGMNESVMKHQQRGWGSEQQTKELREQLRSMEQMLRYTERMAQTMGVHSTNFTKYRQVMNGMSGDLSSLPTRSRTGGWIQDRYGEKAADQFSKMTDALGKLSMLYSGFNIMNTMRQGLSNGQTLAFGFGDLAKRMIPNGGSALRYGQSLLGSMQGYGYDDQSLMQSATMYGNTTGRMPQGQFQSQMQAVLQTGRRFGWDLSQSTQYFAGAYQSGVTGGTNSQMSPQEFATLVANATVRAGMQGRETQFMSQLTALTQITQATSGQAGNNRALSAFIGMGDSTGNQSIINNVSGMFSGINQGIANPNGGYIGQAMMMRAIGQGKMGYFQEQYQQSLGASDPQNVENATNYLLSVYGNDPYKASVMLGQMFNMSPAVAKQYIDTYTKGGKFKTDAFNQLQASLSKTPSSISQNDTETARNALMYKNYQADNAGMNTVPLQGGVNSISGDILSVLGTPLGMVSVAGGAASSIYGTYKMGKGIYNIGKNVLTRGGASAGSSALAGEAVGTAGAVAEGTAGVETAMGVAGGLEVAGAAADSTGVGLPIGVILGLAGLATAGGAAAYSWWKNRGKGSSSAYPISGPPLPSSDSGSTDNSSNMTYGDAGVQLAPVVISTIVALAPYMDQIRSLMGASNTTSGALASGSPAISPSFGTNLTVGNNWQKGLVNLSTGVGTNALGPRTAVGTKGTLNPSTSATQAIDYWSQQYGVPSYISYAIAQAESGLDPNATGDNSTSWGLFQLHQNGGQGTGYTADQLKNPSLNAQIGLKSIAQAYKQAKAKGMQDGPALAQWVAENSGHPGYGVHSSLDDQIYNNAQNILNGTLKIQGTSVTVNLKYPDGSNQAVNIPITASYTNL